MKYFIIYQGWIYYFYLVYVLISATGPGYIIANFISIGPKSSVNVSREMYQQLQLTFILY